MIQVRDIVYVRNNYAINQEIQCYKFTGGDRQNSVKAKIIGKYPYLCLVTDGESRWCIQWVDFIMQSIR